MKSITIILAGAWCLGASATVYGADIPSADENPLRVAQTFSYPGPFYVPTSTGMRRIPSRAKGSGYTYKSAYDAESGIQEASSKSPATKGSAAPGFSLHGMTSPLPPAQDAQSYIPAANTPTLHRAGDTVKPTSTPSQNDSPKTPAKYKDGVYALEKDYYLSYPLNLWRMFSAPARFDTEDWLITAGLAGATGLFLLLDEEIRDFWQGDIHSDTSDDIFDFFNFFGEVKYMGAISLGTYALAEAVDQAGIANAKREKAFGLLALESIALAQGITFSMKWITGRERPNNSDDRYDFNGPGNGTNLAFPSGHATVAFAFATTISEVYGETDPWVPWVAYPIAVGSALSRIDRNKHWASDVFLGGLVGYFVAKTVVKYNPFLEKRDLTLRPLDSVDGPGMSIVRKF